VYYGSSVGGIDFQSDQVKSYRLACASTPRICRLDGERFAGDLLAAECCSGHCVEVAGTLYKQCAPSPGG
jgi:hypothetical protein